jgi:hypothetical protein
MRILHGAHRVRAGFLIEMRCRWKKPIDERGGKCLAPHPAIAGTIHAQRQIVGAADVRQRSRRDGIKV